MPQWGQGQGQGQIFVLYVVFDFSENFVCRCVFYSIDRKLRFVVKLFYGFISFFAAP